MTLCLDTILCRVDKLMKITKRQLRRIIREEKRRVLECGEDMMVPSSGVGITSGPVLESDSPEHDVLVEMTMAARSLELVIESVQNAAQLCPGCVSGVAAQAPVVDAVVSQAEALQEMLNAQVDVIQENVMPETSMEKMAEDAFVAPHVDGSVIDVVLDETGY